MKPSRLKRGLAGLTLVAIGLAAGVTQASATGVDGLRVRAQRVADEVTGLERRLEGLRARKITVNDRMIALTSQIGRLEADLHDFNAAHEAALESYVQRAVEAYKDGASGTRIDMLLSTRDVTDLLTVAEAASVAATLDAERLADLTAARDRAERTQAGLDGRKQELIAAHSEVEAVTEAIETSLSERRSVLAELSRRIKELERQARREALAQGAGATLSSALSPATGASASLPNGYVSTGVTFGGVASWYGPGFEGNSTANGEIFDPMGMTAASKELPFGTLLYVEFEGRGVVVRINDRGPYIGDRILDLSQGAAQVIGLSGIGWVDATIVLKG
ncbi:MAG: septal ring lytic transglycosylase RlpA family protein [Actinomycetota bacterium]